MPDSAFSFTTTPGRQDNTLILKLNGPLTLSSMFTFQNDFRAISVPVLIVDLSASPYMDSAGLGLIMNKHVSSETHGSKFLVAGVNDRIDALLELTRVKPLLVIYPTVEAAEDSLSR